MARTKAKLLLDENIGTLVEASLHRAGFDAVSVLKTMRGASDADVIARALAENRIIITLDRDFGYLVHREAQNHAGVIYLRLNDESPKNIARILKKFARRLPEIAGAFAKVAEDRIVIRRSAR